MYSFQNNFQFKKIPVSIFIAVFVCLISINEKSIAQGTWVPLTHLAPDPSGSGMLLLSDGTVIVKTFSGGGDGIGNIWNRLTPDNNGSYVNGTWTSIAPMNDTRLYYSSQVLKDGRVYVAGGEYGSGGGSGEIYDPLTDVWTMAPSPGGYVSDANSEILPDGKVLQALVTGNLTPTKIFDPISNTYAPCPSTLGIHNESAWVKLPDNSILFIDRQATSSERYIPSLNQWVADATVPVEIYDSFGDETGGALLLPDGRAFFFGALGHTAYYTPSGNNTPGTWAAGPDIPNAQGTPDAPMAMMVNGKILCTTSPIPTSGDHFPTPTSFYVFDYLTNTFTQIGAPAGGLTINESCYITNFLDLPDGTVLYSQQDQDQYYVYVPVGSQLSAGKPTIANITQFSCDSFTVTGTLFNGISEGACYGDDWQMATNYPIIRLNSGLNIFYARTYNWNRTGVQTGNLPDTVQFVLPAGIPSTTFSLVVTANGISSDPVSFTPHPLLSSTLFPAAICSNSTFTYSPTSSASGATFTWTRAAVTGISNPAITIPQTSNPNEVLINTTATPKNVIYAYIITANGCSSTQSVTVTVNPTPTISINGNFTICSGNSTTLTGTGGSSYVWNTGATTTAITISPISNTSYTVTGTNSFGCIANHSQGVTVNPAPTISINGNSTICNGNSTTLTGIGGNSYVWNTGATTAAITVSPTANTTYTVTGANSFGCTANHSQSVTVNPLPNVSVNGNSIICNGASTTLTGMGANNYVWNTGATTAAITVSPTANITYTVTGTNSFGCTANHAQTVTVNPLPTISINGNSIICDGESTTLTGTGANNYEWNTGATTVAITVNPTSNTTYTVTGTNSFGCTANHAQAVTVNPTPTISINGNLTICNGNSTTLTGTGGSSYVWNTSATTDTLNVAPTVNTTYTVTGTNAFGCSAVSSQAVTVNPLPTIAVSGTTIICLGDSSELTATGASTYLWDNNSIDSVISVFPGSTITYSVTGTTSSGCSAMLNVTVTVNQLPAISISGTTAICVGDTSTLQVTGGTTYLWNTTETDSSISVIPISITTYTLTGTGSNGCSSEQQITVTVNPLPVISVSGNDTICKGSSAILTASGAADYLWSNGNSNASITVSPDSTIAYSVTGTNSFGCSTTKSFEVVVDPCIGIEQVENSIINSLLICPNPAEDYAKLIFNSGKAGEYILLMMDVLGRELKSETVTAVAGKNIHSMDFDGYAKGVYFIVIEKENEVFKSKIVIE